MECPVCFSSDSGAYIFTECGHSTCPNCIIRMYDISQHLKCPMCRTAITRAPVIVQAFASNMPDGLVRAMAEHFERWFRRPEQQIQLFTNSTYNDHVENNININNNHNNINNNLENLNREIGINNAASEEWYIITPEISNSQLQISNSVHNLANNWTFIPFNKTIKINVHTDFSERWNNSSLNRFRRVIVYINDISLRDKISDIEQYVFNSFINQNLMEFSEIGIRNNRLSICAHSLSNDSHINTQNFNRNLTLICRGAWKHDGRIGCRWYVGDLY